MLAMEKRSSLLTRCVNNVFMGLTQQKKYFLKIKKLCIKIWHGMASFYMTFNYYEGEKENRILLVVMTPWANVVKILSK
jgi:hypothetical protein